MYTWVQTDAPRDLELSSLITLKMHATPSSNSMDMIGKAVNLKFVKIALLEWVPLEVDSVVVSVVASAVASTVDSEEEADLEEAAAASAEGLADAVLTKVVVEVEDTRAAEASIMEHLPNNSKPPILLPISLLVAANAIL
jgi:hypothetical protein